METKIDLARLAHSPWPSWALSSGFLASSILAPTLAIPPLVFRLGFGTIFAGSGYMTKTGDVRNGNGTTTDMLSVITAWSLTYLFLYTRRTLFHPPRNPWAIALTLGTMGCTGIYGGNYFFVQNFGKEGNRESDLEEE